MKNWARPFPCILSIAFSHFLRRKGPPSEKGILRTCTITKNSVGEWYVVITCEVPIRPLPPKETRVGIDLGLEHFATLSNGEVIPNPRLLKQSAKALAKAQRKRETLPHGSSERRRQAKVVAKIHQKTRNRRENFCHQESKKIIDRYQEIVVKDLTIQKMVEGSFLAKSILDVSWNRFCQFLSYKAEYAGRCMTLVDPAYTSQDCSQCGHREKKSLTDRQHCCQSCGFEAHRDFNAALNIRALGLDGLGESPRSPFLQEGE
jgi:putative transposase